MSPLFRRTVLALALGACAPRAGHPRAPKPAPLEVPPLTRPDAQEDPLAVRFPEGSAPPSGCFARSRRTGAIACLVGHFGAGAEGDRRLTILSTSDDATPDVPVRVRVAGGKTELDLASQRTLDSLMHDGEYMALGAPLLVPPESPRSFGNLIVELRRVESPSDEAIAAMLRSPADLKVIVRASTPPSDASPPTDRTDVLLENTLASVACSSPNLAVRVLEPNLVLVERECRLEEEAEVVVGAWLCDSERARCD
jgi:hypothetical protein